MRLVTDEVLAKAADVFKDSRLFTGSYREEMINHPVAGRCLLNYAILTDRPQVLDDSEFSTADVFWSRYYWLVRFSRVWSTVAGNDAGLEQQVFQLLENPPVGLECWPEVEAAAERDAVEQLRSIGAV